MLSEDTHIDECTQTLHSVLSTPFNLLSLISNILSNLEIVFFFSCISDSLYVLMNADMIYGNIMSFDIFYLFIKISSHCLIYLIMEFYNHKTPRDMYHCKYKSIYKFYVAIWYLLWRLQLYRYCAFTNDVILCLPLSIFVSCVILSFL